MPAPVRPSPLGLAVLGLLCGGPLHPYRMQRLVKEWGKDQVINVGQRSSLYKTIDRLAESELIAARQVERPNQYPERTVYEITDDGRQVVLQWLTDMLSKYRNEYPRFPAALSFAMLLGPEGTLSALQERFESLDAAVGELQRHGHPVLSESATNYPTGERISAGHGRSRTALGRKHRGRTGQRIPHMGLPGLRRRNGLVPRRRSIKA